MGRRFFKKKICFIGTQVCTWLRLGEFFFRKLCVVSSLQFICQFFRRFSPGQPWSLMSYLSVPCLPETPWIEQHLLVIYYVIRHIISSFILHRLCKQIKPKCPGDGVAWQTAKSRGRLSRFLQYCSHNFAAVLWIQIN